jgi:hypothetical protein
MSHSSREDRRGLRSKQKHQQNQNATFKNKVRIMEQSIRKNSEKLESLKQLPKERFFEQNDEGIITGPSEWKKYNIHLWGDIAKLFLHDYCEQFYFIEGGDEYYSRIINMAVVFMKRLRANHKITVSEFTSSFTWISYFNQFDHLASNDPDSFDDNSDDESDDITELT